MLSSIQKDLSGEHSRLSREWFAVHTRSRHEFAVKSRLEDTGMEVFLPVIEKLQRWKDRNKKVLFPLFPGYLFIHIGRSHHDILTVLKIKGVVRILATPNDELLSVPDEQIAFIKKLVEKGNMLDPYPYLKEGTRVRIKFGPLAGVEGVLIEKSGQYKVVISVDIIQQSAALTVDINNIEKT